MPGDIVECGVFKSEDLLAESGYTPAAASVLWYVMQSEHPTLDANQVCISADGLVGADHCF